MEIYEGKTKRVIRTGDKIIIKFKDAITGSADGKPDPGGNFVVGTLPGKSVAAARVATYFFEVLRKGGIDTHFYRLHSDTEIEVLLTERIRLEVIYRAKAYGSFLARYRNYVEPMAYLDIVEFTLKDDSLGDPLIAPQAIVRLGIASEDEVKSMETTARKVAQLVNSSLSSKGLELVDMKLEFGRRDNKLLIIDELSGDTMRIYDPGQKRMLNQVELAERLGLI
jgi:phosphoribosylaminoimidazole-succinocarboxamide synthase